MKNAGVRPRPSGFSLAPIMRHKVFVPALAVWGALAGGLSVLALSQGSVVALADVTGLAALGSFARIIFALLAAIFVAAGAAIAATLIRGGFDSGDLFQAPAMFKPKAQQAPTPVKRKRHFGLPQVEPVEPIDPRTELGSESLDSPFEPPASAPAEDDADQASEDLIEVEEEEATEQDAWEIAAPPSHGAFEEARQLGDGDAEEVAYEDFEELDEGLPAGDLKDEEPDATEAAETWDDAWHESAGREVDHGGEETQHPAIEPKPSEPEDTEDAEILDISAYRSFEEPRAQDETSTPARAAFEPSAHAAPCFYDNEVAPEPAAEAVNPIENSCAVRMLRQTPADELSLVQLVERFAAALHEHEHRHAGDQRMKGTAPQGWSAASLGAQADSDAALAQALRALTLFSDSSLGSAPGNNTGRAAGDSDADELLHQTEERLREALERLQDMRGAA